MVLPNCGDWVLGPRSRTITEVPMADFNPIEVQKHLKGVDYPASKDELVSHAESSGAPKEVVDELRSMDKDSFDGPNAVVQAISKSS
jgi:hypothetical protein